MALQFWLGGERSDKQEKMFDYILSCAADNPGREYLVIVPEQFTLSVQRQLVARSANKGILNVDVLSFMRLAHRISDEVGFGRADVTMLDDMGKNLILQLLAERNIGKLSVFGSNIDKLGYIGKIKSILSEFMQYGIEKQKVKELAKSAGANGRGMLEAKLNDICILYEAFEEYIRDKYTTTEELLDKIASLVPYSDTVKNCVLVFDGFTGFTPVQIKLIATLMEYAKDIHVALTCENIEGPAQEHELFYLSRKTISTLEELADKRQIVIKDYYRAKDIKQKAEIEIYRDRNPIEEVRTLARSIVDLVNNHGYGFKDIAVLTGDIEGYRHIFDRVMQQFGIPYFIDRTEALLLNPFVEYIRALLAIFSDNYSYESMFRYLKSGLCDYEREQIDELDNYCLASGIKGYKRWHERFIAPTEKCSEGRLLEMDKLRQSITQHLAIFSSELGKKATVKEYSTALYNMIVSDDIENKLAAMAEKFAEAGEGNLASEYSQVYLRVMNILDELVMLIPDEKVSISDYGKLIDAGLDSIRIGVAPKNMDYVQIGDLTRSRVGKIRQLFITGVNDGIIPKTSPSGGIINESDREFLTNNNPELVLAPSAREDAFTQRLYLYMAMNKPDDKLILSYSSVGTDGKSLMPSYLIKQVMKENSGVRVRTVDNDLNIKPTSIADVKATMSSLLGKLIANEITSDEYNYLVRLTEYLLSDEKCEEETKALIEKVVAGGDKEPDDAIGKAVATALYGNNIVGSVTRLETYANCAYRYFLQYGLKLREREQFSFEAKDLGNVFHDTLAEFCRLMERSESNWFDITEDMIAEHIDRAVDTTVAKLHMSALYSTARTAYMVNRVKRIMRRTAGVLSDQIKCGKFKPGYFEIDFGEMKSLSSLNIRLSDDEMMRLKGRIDRIDTYEKDNAVYIKIMDYKSSAKKLDFAAIYEGRQLQLLVYLNAAIENEKNQRGGHADVVPAGILYYHIDDPVVEDRAGATDEEIKFEIMKKLRLAGLMNSDDNGAIIEMIDSHLNEGSNVVSISRKKDGELKKSSQLVSGSEFDELREFVGKKLADMGRDILDGNIAVPKPDGIKRFSDPDCKYCEYAAVCQNQKIGDFAEGEPDGDEGTSEDAQQSGRIKVSDEEIMELIRNYK